MKSGMIAAEAVFDILSDTESVGREATGYQPALRESWLWQELHAVRNIRPSFRWVLLGGMAYSALDTQVLRGKAPGTLPHHEDHKALGRAADFKQIHYPRPDGTISFDRLSSVFLSNTNHAEIQPCHLKPWVMPEGVGGPNYPDM